MITCERCTVRPAAVVRAYTYSGRWRVCHPCAIRLDRHHATVPATLPLVKENPALPMPRRGWAKRQARMQRRAA